MKKLLAAILLTAGLAGCATYQPVPKDYTGPVSIVSDTGTSEGSTKARMFALVAVEGNRIPNAFSASAIASHGQGAMLSTVYPQRTVQSRPMKVLIRGSHATGAPIHAIASKAAGTFFSVEGEVEFTPEAGRSYRVNGDLKKERSSVWIEDALTGSAVTSVISQ